MARERERGEEEEEGGRRERDMGSAQVRVRDCCAHAAIVSRCFIFFSLLFSAILTDGTYVMSVVPVTVRH